MLPPLLVLLPTYNRPQIIRQTIERHEIYLRYAGEIQYLVGDDGDDPQALLRALEPLPRVTIQRGPQQGLGANLNMLLKTAYREQFVVTLQQDDDHWLRMPFEVTRHVQELLDNSLFGVIRLMGVAGHHYSAELHENYWWLRWDSPELYLASNRPHLQHKRFHDCFGYYPEGLKLGQTEDSFCHQVRDEAREVGGPVIAVPLEVQSESAWDHVGHSWQETGR